LVRTIPSGGLIISNAAEAALERVLSRGCWTPLQRFNEAAGWRAEGDDASGQLRICCGADEMGATQWGMSGDCNRNNALAALLAARHVGVPIASGLQALASFAGVRRRLEWRGEAAGVAVYDDFAHHPTAIAATLAALRGRVGAARIIAALEPRSNTMKQGVMKDALAPSLAAADAVFCCAAGLDWDAAAALAPLGDKAVVAADIDQLTKLITTAARPGDHVLLMSNGAFGGVHDKLLAALAHREGASGAPEDC